MSMLRRKQFPKYFIIAFTALAAVAILTPNGRAYIGITYTYPLLLMNPSNDVLRLSLANNFMEIHAIRQAKVQCQIGYSKSLSEVYKIIFGQMLGSIYIYENNESLAIDIYEELANAYPDRSGFHLMLGQIYAKNKMYAKALYHYNKELELCGGVDPEIEELIKNISPKTKLFEDSEEQSEQ